MITAIKYWYWRRFKHEVHPDEVRRLVCDAIIEKGSRAGHRKYQMAALYGQGVSLEDVAKEFNVTRERVRQVAFRIYWDSKRPKDAEYLEKLRRDL